MGDALFTNAGSSANDKQAVLVLERVDMVQISGAGFASYEISEQLTARWALYTADKGKRFFHIDVNGSAVSAPDWGSGIAENAKDRMGRAYQDFLQ